MQLLERGGLYSEMWAKQLQKKEAGSSSATNSPCPSSNDLAAMAAAHLHKSPLAPAHPAVKSEPVPAVKSEPVPPPQQQQQRLTAAAPPPTLSPVKVESAQQQQQRLADEAKARVGPAQPVSLPQAGDEGSSSSSSAAPVAPAAAKPKPKPTPPATPALSQPPSQPAAPSASAGAMPLVVPADLSVMKPGQMKEWLRGNGFGAQADNLAARSNKPGKKEWEKLVRDMVKASSPAASSGSASTSTS